jgi:hypothetical protein
MTTSQTPPICCGLFWAVSAVRKQLKHVPSGFRRDMNITKPLLMPCLAWVTALAAAWPHSCYADESEAGTPPVWSLKGFGSLVATRTTDDRVGWRVQNQPIDQARAHAGNWTFSAESLVGIQADVFAHRDWSGTVQVLAMDRSRGRVEPAVELAFLRHEVTPEWQIRLGRIWTPSFMNSETRYVGYANTTVRNTNYTLYQITNLNGGDVRYKTRLADGNAMASAYYGSNHYALPDNAAGQDDYFNLPLIAGGFVSWERGEWLIRGSYTRIDLARHGAANTGILNTTVPALKAAAADGSCDICANEARKWARVWDGTDYRVATLASKYTGQNWSVSAEAVQRTTDGIFPDTRGWDLEFNWFAGPLTCYADYLRAWSYSNNKPVFSLPQFASLNRTYAAGKIDREITTLGIKYHLSENFAVRGEVAHIRFDDPLAGVGFAPLSTGATGLPGSYNLLSMTLDFVF